MATGETRTFEDTKTAGDVTRTYLVTRVAYRNAGGEIAGVFGISRDITDRKISEDELKKSEERFEILAEATFEGIVVSEGSKILETNQYGAEVLGYEPSEIVGRNILEFISPEYHDVVRRHMATGSEEPYEIVIVRRDGTPIEAEVRSKAFYYRDRPVRLTAVRDVSEQKALERRLRHLAFHDPLIGLANRNLFSDSLSSAPSHGRSRVRSPSPYCS